MQAVPRLGGRIAKKRALGKSNPTIEHGEGRAIPIAAPHGWGSGNQQERGGQEPRRRYPRLQLRVPSCEHCLESGRYKCKQEVVNNGYW